MIRRQENLNAEGPHPQYRKCRTRSHVGALVALFACACPGLVIGMELTRSEFVSAYPSHEFEGFDSLQTGTTAPLAFAGKFILTGSQSEAPEVLDDLVGMDNAFWFGGFGSPGNFVLANDPGYLLTFDSDVIAIGFEASCFACGASAITLSFFSAEGELQQTHTIDLPSFSVNGQFLSFVPTAPFAEVEIVRDTFSNWLIDSVRFEPLSLFHDGFEN